MDKINKDKFYSIKGVANLGVLPWRDAKTIRSILEEEKWTNVFKPFIDKKKERTLIYIKGENIIKFLISLEKGN